MKTLITLIACLACMPALPAMAEPARYIRAYLPGDPSNDLNKIEIFSDADQVFIEEGLLWFPDRKISSNAMQICECLATSSVTSKCVTRRCWVLAVSGSGSVDKKLETYGIKEVSLTGRPVILRIGGVR